jgi:hypothetical protein
MSQAAAERMFPTITDEALASLRAFAGQPVRRGEPYIEAATRDAIRHWAHGIGDRNPSWAEHRVAPRGPGQAPRLSVHPGSEPLAPHAGLCEDRAGRAL